MATSAMDTEKWETGIDATATDIKEVKAFVDWRLSIYKENGWKGFDLWENFINDFESFTKDILDSLGKDQLKKTRDYLRENGVYIQKEARKSKHSLIGAYRYTRRMDGRDSTYGRALLTILSRLQRIYLMTLARID